MNTADTYAYAIRKPDGTLHEVRKGYPPVLWGIEGDALHHIACCHFTLVDCTVVRVRITTEW